MKTLTLSFAIAIVLSFGFANRSDAQTTFQISNQQADPLGQVTVSTSGGDYYVNVAGNETDTVQIADTAVSVTINGQRIPQGQKALIQLATGKQVALIWTAPNSITVINEDIPA